MRYELLLQPALSKAPFETAVVEAALPEHKATRRLDGAWCVALPHGEVTLVRLFDEGQLKGFTVQVPLSHQLDLVRETLEWGVAFARETGLALVDPRQMRPLTLADEGSLTDAYLQTAKYAGEYAGVSEAVLAAYGTHEPGAMSMQVKVLLAIGAFIALVLWVWSKLQ
ncbi:MAG: hypothetical protein K1X64_23060 [Myxococcaceae bacterium]|nr:hypothetical protein [Myxococcaceae bacterium]